MDEFLRKIQLSEEAIKIYLKSLGKLPLSYYELLTIVPRATPEEFNEILNELIDAGLLIQQTSKEQLTAIKYLPVPPILPILNYYENINSNLITIKNSIQVLMINSVNTIFQENKNIELDTILNTFQEIKKDIEEDSIIQKQEVEDIVEGMEELKNIKKNISDLSQNIKNLMQKKFLDILNNLKSEIIKNINSMEFKKHKNEILSLIEQNFKKDKLGDFTNNLDELIVKEFDKTSKPIDSTSELIFQYRNDFKILLLNMLNNFETNINKIHELLRENKDNLFAAMKNLEINVVENLNDIIQNSIDEISNLNKPVEKVMRNYFQEIHLPKKSIINNVWIINSITKFNEEVQNLIAISKETLTIIIPYIENHLAIEQFERIADNLKIKIASSEAHTNSIVKNFKNIKNLIFKTYQNDNLIALNSDNKLFIIGVFQESKDPLNNFVGIGTTFEPLINLLNPLIKNIWEEAYSDSFHATQVMKAQLSKKTLTEAFKFKALTAAKPIIPPKISSVDAIKKPSKIENGKIKPIYAIPEQIQEIPKGDERSPKNQMKYASSPKISESQITDLKQKLQEKIEFLSAAQPRTGDKAGMEINVAFTNLIQKLNNLKGDEFSKELQDIADLILEKKGFSVTLHKVRSTINKYKEKFTLLDANDKKEIIEKIESWKKKIF
ncbi:MAG: hypothetical protein JSV23_01230 [Promethearchaeota archaeon]|nr:MAG: hypothetical protein JSV23_01230 [Candidatus Lokiarchaeota archaeon]